MRLDRELWVRARRLFDELTQLDESERQRRLSELAAHDPELGDAVKRLLTADATSESALDDYLLPSPSSGPQNDHRVRDPLRLAGHNVSHFRVLDCLAAGGMGVVYRAEDLHLGRTVALKFPLPDQQLDPMVQERFINEARSAAALDHPSLCTVYETGESEHGVFLAMPLYPGVTLKDRIARDGPLPPNEALNIIVQIAGGVGCAHQAGIVHRDLKPGNVMILPGGGVKVLDFGLAKVRDVSLSGSRGTLGTIRYMSPEQIRNGPVDARTDLWSIGVMLYEMLTGRPPFTGEHEISVLHSILHDDPPSPSELNTKVPLRFNDLVAGLLQKDAASRYQSADSLLADALALDQGTALAFRRAFWSRTSRRRRMRKASPLLAAAAAVFAIGAGSWSAYRGSSRQGNLGENVPRIRFEGDTALVSTSVELLAALVPKNSGRHVRLRAGTYDLSAPLTVPDRITLEGEGDMGFDSAGHATGFSGKTHTTLRMTASVGGDMLTLGRGVAIRKIEIVDLAGRAGNVVAVKSRKRGDSVSATIFQSVIVNPNVLGLGASALGRALVVTTRNLNMGADPAPEEGSDVAVNLLQSVIRSPVGGGGFFAFNFAAKSTISLQIRHSTIGGTNEANGGVSLPDAVHDSRVDITSEENIYRNEWDDRCASPLLGWNLTGGSSAPMPLRVPETSSNQLRLRSVHDHMDGFTTAVLATGSRRFFAAPLNAAPRDNHIELHLIGTRISTPTCATVREGQSVTGVAASRLGAVRDFQLTGAWVQNESMTPGENNSIKVEMVGVTASGARANQYASAATGSGPLPTRLQGKGNRLEILGNSQIFARSNRNIDPAPAGNLFSGK